MPTTREVDAARAERQRRAAAARDGTATAPQQLPLPAGREHQATPDDEPPCSTCITVGRRGYCALGRCYCAHPTCWAFASWSPLPPVGELLLEASALVPPKRWARPCPNGRPISDDGQCCGQSHDEARP